MFILHINKNWYEFLFFTVSTSASISVSWAPRLPPGDSYHSDWLENWLDVSVRIPPSCIEHPARNRWKTKTDWHCRMKSFPPAESSSSSDPTSSYGCWWNIPFHHHCPRRDLFLHVFYFLQLFLESFFSPTLPALDMGISCSSPGTSNCCVQSF